MKTLEKNILFKAMIPGRAGILKNSRKLIIVRHRPMFIPSKKYKEWESMAIEVIRVEACQRGRPPIDFPVNLTARFYFENHQHEADLSNLYQGIEDVLEKCGVLANDKFIISHNGSKKIFNREAKVEIELSMADRE